ncbi:RNA 2',3'-cyclic phosphodiesterase [Pedosphaera parvula]|uniref:RNA 2',3'-cyclic phosphodiesterase n=1 Tax=Pedosphaera parvula (strain Ellin514) TaxID=320771 RepID=B9XIZ0_PEDPL|nr:RNA 2',3'-cyclic phosphodiesterase [Pedosphaera parvula]EEF60217.1 2'-5' RNA ligase [Pedosphaera parvula Ellin514]
MPEIEKIVEIFRLFIALPVPEFVKEELKRVQSELRLNLPGGSVRWTRMDQCHLTLRFLGNVPSDAVSELSAAVKRSCSEFPLVHLKAERIGFFPNERRPRVIWVGVSDDSGNLRALQAVLSKAVSPFTTEVDAKIFSGHLTLGRIQNLHARDVKMLGDLARGSTDRIFGEWTADRIDIMRSELGAQGSRHSCLESITLGSTCR